MPVRAQHKFRKITMDDIAYDVKWIMGRIHVATPDTEVADEIFRRLNYDKGLERVKAELGLTGDAAEAEAERQLTFLLGAALFCHRANMDEYRWVMGSH